MIRPQYLYNIILILDQIECYTRGAVFFLVNIHKYPKTCTPSVAGGGQNIGRRNLFRGIEFMLCGKKMGSEIFGLHII